MRPPMRPSDSLTVRSPRGQSVSAPPCPAFRAAVVAWIWPPASAIPLTGTTPAPADNLPPLITATSPPGTPTADVIVTTPNRTSPATPADVVAYLGPGNGHGWWARR